jgi:hypothetical protein
MISRIKKSRFVLITAFIAMLIGAIDPLEGSIVILVGIGLAALNASLNRSDQKKILCWGLGLTVAGIGAMVALSAVGGIGGKSGRAMWWGLFVLTYPIGWILGLIGVIRMLIESFRGKGSKSNEQVSQGS